MPDTYDPADWTAEAARSEQYEQQVMAQINKQPLVDHLKEDTFLDDLGRNANISLRNYAAITAGVIPDLLQMGADTLAHLMVARSPEVPFTSEELAEKFGGDPNHPSFFVNSFAPTPTGALKATKAGIMGAIGIKNMGMEELASQADNLLARGGDELTVFNKTGVYRDSDGALRMWRTDKDLSVDMTGLEHDALQRLAPRLKPGQINTLHLPLPEIIKDDDLYKAYPQLRDYQFGFAAHIDENGVVKLGHSDPSYATRGAFNPDKRRFTSFLSDPAEVRDNAVHEIQHAIDEIEGFAFGDNPAVYDKIIDDWHENVVERSILRSFKEGSLDLETMLNGSINMSIEDAATVRKIMADNHIPVTPEAFRLVTNQITELANRTDAAYGDIDGLLMEATTAGRSLRSKIKGFTVPLVESGVMDADEAALLVSLGPQGLADLGFERYYSNPGEVRARLAQLLKDADAANMKKIPKIEEGVTLE